MTPTRLPELIQKRLRSGSLYSSKDTRLQLLQIKIMASAVAAIYIYLPTSVTITYRERDKNDVLVT